jgi:hypothetical protein
VGIARGMRSFVSVLAASAVAAMSPADGAPATAPTWSIQRIRMPAGTTSAVLTAVSCPSRVACTAVGYATARSGAGVALAEHWNGARWSIERTAVLPGARGSLLFGVACPSATVCTAVGSVISPSGRSRPLTERWNGSRWTGRPIPAPAGRVSYLGGVSCSSPADCTAVGYAGDRLGTAGVALTERWSASRSTIERTIRPTTARASFLSGVSCTGPRACTAVGYSNEADGSQVLLAERWNGTRWTVQPIPRLPGEPSVQLAGVACASETSCMAAGFFTTVTGIDVMLADRWHGARWARQMTRYPDGARYVRFAGVSCASPRSCTAAGLFNDVQGRDAILAERWNGVRWTISRLPTIAGASRSSLGAVSCRSATTCTAVGSFTDRAGAEVPLAMHH